MVIALGLIVRPGSPVPQVRPSFGLTWVRAGAWKSNWNGQPEIVVSEYPADQHDPLPRLASKARTRTWGTRLFGITFDLLGIARKTLCIDRDEGSV